MARRHWVLLLLWAGLIATVVGVAILRSDDHALLGLPFMVSPIVAIVALVRLFRRGGPEPMTRRWAIAQRVLAGLGVALALGGLVGSASQLVEIDGETTLRNGPLALLFLASLIGCYSALVRPTPRNTAWPAAIVHVTWVPLVLINLRYEGMELVEWQQALAALGLLGLLAVSALASIVALAGFAGEPPARVPEARQL